MFRAICNFTSMSEIEKSKQPKIYLAPLQGFTDFVYRKVYSQVFSGIDAFFIPYISVKNHEILRKYQKEVLPENNQQSHVVPQVLAASPDEMEFLASYISDLGYSEINLNLGCPYPMVTNRGMGAGLLPFPDKVREIIAAAFEISGLKLSVKMRAGLNSASEMEKILPVLNQFPLTEVILHPRIAKQLYEGEINDEAFRFATGKLIHRLVYNGDLHSYSSWQQFQDRYPDVDHFMLGRGVLMNPFLPAEIKGFVIGESEKNAKLTEFHNLMLEEYLKVMDNEGNALNKMVQFWSWFCYQFPSPKKCFKQIQKARGMGKYKQEVRDIFRQLIS